MKPERPLENALIAVALVWCVAVLVSYYHFNHQYYLEKITVFSRFLLDLLGS